MIKKFNNLTPKLGKNVYISDNAVVIGDVEIGDEVNIWFGSVIRGDMHYVKIGSQTNIQVNEGIPFGQGNYGKLMEKLLTNV